MASLLTIKKDKEQVRIYLFGEVMTMTRGEALEWCMDGIIGCDGAEQEHFIDCLIQLNNGDINIYY